MFFRYTKPTINFKIPPPVFYPKPDVDSALVTLDFRKGLMLDSHSYSGTSKKVPVVDKPYEEGRIPRIRLGYEPGCVNPLKLRRVLNAAFQMRRKMLRVSLKSLLANVGGQQTRKLLSEKWAERRPESLTPLQFLQLTYEVYGDSSHILEPGQLIGDPIWRKNIT